MADLPKIAQARLRRQQASSDAGAHPDANILSAFVEGSLAESERGNLMAHLSDCADCREVVALSLPELDANIVQKPAATTSWLTNLGMMRWTAVAAGIVIVGAAVMLMDPKQSGKLSISQDSSDRATELVPAAPTAPPLAAQATRQEPEADNRPAEKSKTSNDKLSARNDAGSVGKVDNQFSGEGKALGGVIKNIPSKGRNFSPIRESEAAPSAASVKSSPNQYALNDKASQPASSDSAVMDSKKSATQPGSGAGSGSGIGTGSGGGIGIGEGRGLGPGFAGGIAGASPSGTPAKKSDSPSPAVVPPPPPPAANTVNRARSVGPAANNNAADLAANNNANSNSEIFKKQAAKTKDESAAPRSFNETVEVSATAEAVEVNTASAKIGWNVTGGKLFSNSDGSSRWKEIKLAGNPRLTTLSVQPTDIWVGGAKGVLYHSPDSGKTWLPVTGGWSPHSDITYLAFRDPQNGELRTSKNDRWTTSDSGKSWQKQ